MAGLVKTDEELAQIEEEVIVDNVSPEEPEEAELDSGFELEIIDPSLYGGEKSKALVEAETKLAELEAKQKEQEAVTGREMATATNMAAIKQMQEQLAGGITVKQAPVEAPGTMFDREAHNAKYNKNLYNNPAKETEEFIAPYMMELNNKIDSVNRRADQNASKANMLENDKARGFYNKHKEEIDTAVLNLPAGSDMYQKALSGVQSLHMDEIVAERVAEEVAKLNLAPGAKPPLTNVGKQSAPAMKGKTQVTPGMHKYMEAMKMKGMGDQDWLLNRAKELKTEGVITN